MSNSLKTHIQQLYNGNDSPLAPEASQREALQLVGQKKFPGPKHEAWRHTDISPLLGHGYQKARPKKIDVQAVSKYQVPDMEVNLLVFVNGFLNWDLSRIQDTEEDIIIKPLAKARQEHAAIVEKYFEHTGIRETNIFSAMNTAYAPDGLFIYVPKGKSVKYPVHLLHLGHPEGEELLAHPRNLFVADEISYVKIMESYHGHSDGTLLTNVATEMIVKRSAHVDYYILQSEGDNNYQVNHLFVNQLEGSMFNCNTLTLCGGLIRNEIHLTQEEEHCQASLYGLFLGKRKQHFDNYVVSNHLKPDGRSNQVYRGIMDGPSSAVYFGKVYVAPDAQQVYTEQSNKNVLIGSESTVHSKPQLEIYADDVACAHGSTTGQLEKDAIFYLRARGIEKNAAQAMLLYAFADEILQKITLPPLKALGEKLLLQHLHGGNMDKQCSQTFAALTGQES